MALKIYNRQQMKRNPTLHCVEFLDTNRKNIADIGLWCDINNILNDRLKYTMFNAEITVVCTEEQLSYILLKFGANSD